MQNKIAELTDQLYKEGVEKGRQQAQEIVDEAQQKASKIIDDAKKQAEKIRADAASEAEELKRNVASEIKLSGQQALSSIKQQILDVVTAQAVDTGITKTLDDPAVMKEMVATVVGSWKAGSDEPIELEVLLPQSKKEELEKSLVNAIQKSLKGGLDISFSRGIKGGFQIGPQNGSFKVSLTDEDFVAYFKEFARPKARAYLFEGNAKG